VGTLLGVIVITEITINDRVVANEGEIEGVDGHLYGNFYPCNFDEIDFLAMKDVYDLYEAFGIELKQ
jgi:hypothetical protein